MRKHVTFNRSIKFLPRFYSFKCIHEHMNLHIYYVPLLSSISLFFDLLINLKNEQKLIVIDFNSEETSTLIDLQQTGFGTKIKIRGPRSYATFARLQARFARLHVLTFHSTAFE